MEPTFLIIHHDESLMELFRQVLQDHANVVFASDAKSAFRNLKNQAFDLCFLDCLPVDGSSQDLLRQIKRQDPLLDIARKLEELALSDSYFVDHHLYPNVDFYSGIIYRALGIPTDMFTVLFAIGRLPGWIAQWKEQHDDPNTKIQRPRQIYTGPTISDYVPLDKR